MTAFAALSLPMPLICEVAPLIMEQSSGSNRSSNNPSPAGGSGELLSKRSLEGTGSLASSGWLGVETASIGNPNSVGPARSRPVGSDKSAAYDTSAPAPQRHPGVSVTHAPDQPEEEAPDHQTEACAALQSQLSREESIICNSFPAVS
jgi:hypothetical protein